MHILLCFQFPDFAVFLWHTFCVIQCDTVSVSSYLSLSRERYVCVFLSPACKYIQQQINTHKQTVWTCAASLWVCCFLGGLIFPSLLILVTTSAPAFTNTDICSTLLRLGFHKIITHMLLNTTNLKNINPQAKSCSWLHRTFVWMSDSFWNQGACKWWCSCCMMDVSSLGRVDVL